MSQINLDYEAPAIARNTDPETSHDAAATVDTNKNRRYLLELLRMYKWSLTDEEIAFWYSRTDFPPQSGSGLRTRRSELVRQGLVVADGEGVTQIGRRCLKWRAL